MSTQYSMSELLDMAVEKLPFLRRRVAQLRLRNSKYRTAFLDELTLKCCDNAESSEILGTVACVGLMSGEITTTTKFAIDPDKLERLLQILIEYLPKLLEIILPLFMQTILLLLAFSLLGTAANAQQCDPATGQCHPVKNALAATAEVAGKTLSAIGDAITPDCSLAARRSTRFVVNDLSRRRLRCSLRSRVALTRRSTCVALAVRTTDTASPPPVSSVQTFYATSHAYSTTTSYSTSWSKSWHKVHGQPARNLGRRIFGR